MRSEFGYDNLPTLKETDSVVSPEDRRKQLVSLFIEYAVPMEEAQNFVDDLGRSNFKAERMSEANTAKDKFRTGFANLSPTEQQKCIDTIRLEASEGKLELHLESFLKEVADLIKAGVV